MDINTLYKKFTQGMKYNAMFYAIRKSMSTILTILLFKKLTTQDFSLWANIYSAIFLTLLWLDFGFRKSLPRYCPQFAKNKNVMRIFIKYIILFQSTVLIIFTPIFILVSKYTTQKLHLTNKIEIFYLGCALFFAQGIISIFRLIYHSYFWQKQFNSTMSIIVIFKSSINFLFILTIASSYILLKYIIVTEVLATFTAIIISIIMLKRLYKSKKDTFEQITQKNLARNFVFHSGIMWVNNNLKSLSERNFMLLFFTHLLGPVQANLFKLANDGALLFQRIVIKTIGTTDTSLLSHIQITNFKKIPSQKTKIMQAALENVIVKISYLCIPLLGALFFITYNFGYLFSNTFAFKIFFLIAMFYLFEYILSPYERLLEVKRKYLFLTISYIPYIIILIFLYFFTSASSSLVKTVLIIHAARISIYLLILLFIQKDNRKFPFKKIIKITLITLLAYLFLTIIIKTLVFFKTSFITIIL